MKKKTIKKGKQNLTNKNTHTHSGRGWKHARHLPKKIAHSGGSFVSFVENKRV